MTRPCGKLPEILQLRSAIAFAEGVDIVHIPDDLPGPRREVGSGETFERRALHDLAMHVVHTGLDVLPELKLAPSLGHLHGADLPGPVVDVLKQMEVDGPQVSEVEIPAWHALNGPLCHQTALHTIKGSRGPDVQLISKDGCPRPEVGIVTHSAATDTGSPFACAMM